MSSNTPKPVVRYCPHLTSQAPHSSCQDCAKVFCGNGCGEWIYFNTTGKAKWVCQVCCNKFDKGVQQLERCAMHRTDKEIKESIDRTIAEGCKPEDNK